MIFINKKNRAEVLLSLKPLLCQPTGRAPFSKSVLLVLLFWDQPTSQTDGVSFTSVKPRGLGRYFLLHRLKTRRSLSVCCRAGGLWRQGHMHRELTGLSGRHVGGQPPPIFHLTSSGYSPLAAMERRVFTSLVCAIPAPTIATCNEKRWPR